MLVFWVILDSVRLTININYQTLEVFMIPRPKSSTLCSQDQALTFSQALFLDDSFHQFKQYLEENSTTKNHFEI